MRSSTIRTLVISLAAMGIISYLLIWKFAGTHFAGAYFLGALIGILSGGVGFYTIEMFIDKSSIVFLRGISLGMGIRLVLLLGIFVLLMEVFHVEIIPLVTGLLIFYFTISVFEVIYLNKRMALRKTGKGTGQ